MYLVYNTISNLLTQDEQVECFRNAARHLVPGGRFVVELWVPQLRTLPPGQSATVFRAEPGYLGLDTYDVPAQRVVSHHVRFDPDAAGAAAARCSAARTGMRGRRSSISWAGSPGSSWRAGTRTGPARPHCGVAVPRLRVSVGGGARGTGRRPAGPPPDIMCIIGTASTAALRAALVHRPSRAAPQMSSGGSSPGCGCRTARACGRRSPGSSRARRPASVRTCPGWLSTRRSRRVERLDPRQPPGRAGQYLRRQVPDVDHVGAARGRPHHLLQLARRSRASRSAQRELAAGVRSSSTSAGPPGGVPGERRRCRPGAPAAVARRPRRREAGRAARQRRRSSAAVTANGHRGPPDASAMAITRSRRRSGDPYRQQVHVAQDHRGVRLADLRRPQIQPGSHVPRCRGARGEDPVARVADAARLAPAASPARTRLATAATSVPGAAQLGLGHGRAPAAERDGQVPGPARVGDSTRKTWPRGVARGRRPASGRASARWCCRRRRASARRSRSTSATRW